LIKGERVMNSVGRKRIRLNRKEVMAHRTKSYPEIASLLGCSVTAIRNFVIRKNIRKTDNRFCRKNVYCYVKGNNK